MSAYIVDEFFSAFSAMLGRIRVNINKKENILFPGLISPQL